MPSLFVQHALKNQGYNPKNTHTFEMNIQKVNFTPLPSRMGFPCSSVGKESACSSGDLGLIPGLGRSPAEGNGNPFQYPCLENLMDTGAWWAAVHEVAKSRA